uniref:Uncharacterized protein n=1 Tax=Anguilla anguilla TaxID=7936 RepID=A0A0E9SFQ4_ANGAN
MLCQACNAVIFSSCCFRGLFCLYFLSSTSQRKFSLINSLCFSECLWLCFPALLELTFWFSC